MSSTEAARADTGAPSERMYQVLRVPNGSVPRDEVPRGTPLPSRSAAVRETRGVPL